MSQQQAIQSAQSATGRVYGSVKSGYRYTYTTGDGTRTAGTYLTHRAAVAERAVHVAVVAMTRLGYSIEDARIAVGHTDYGPATAAMRLAAAIKWQGEYA